MKRKLLFRAASAVILACVALVSLTPFVYLLTTSLVSDMSLVFKNGIALEIQRDMLGLSNYLMLYTENTGLFFSWFKNSVVITIMFTALSVLFSSMVGYGAAMYQFKGKKFIIVMILSTMMIPIETLMIPLYNEMRAFHLLNTYAGVVLPFAVSSFTIYFFLQYAQTLSKDFMDAARIDGCGEIRIFANIMIPLMKPAFASMIILQATTAWNDFLWPLIVMSKNRSFTLTVGLQTYLSPYGSNYNLLFAGAVVSVVPVIIPFFACQKLFMEGMIMGGIKG
ncbi:MAG: carbohydrate ABC transporter permease [Lachnospiraceae bacterium]|jgi:arabinosaccharide transport system permease protein|nr:carbohydrate ABC transporter permease [Lachnospiraceae bacterium]